MPDYVLFEIFLSICCCDDNLEKLEKSSYEESPYYTNTL